MEIEYKQWIFITDVLQKKIEEILFQKNKNYDKIKYEWENIFSSWLIIMNQDELMEKYNFFPIIPKIIITIENDWPTSAKTLLKLVINHPNFLSLSGLNEEQIQNVLKEIFDYIEKKHDECVLGDLPLNLRIEYNCLYLEKFKMKECPNLKYFIENIDNGKWNKNDIAKMMLRYESCGNCGYQWSLPLDIYECFYSEYGVRYEGFVSPFNYNLIGRDGHQYCSLFPDTDTVFGSMGSFFDVNLLEYNGTRWNLNPPYIEDLLEKISDKVIQALDADLQNTFFCIYPFWPDNVSWKKLDESKYTIGQYSDKKLCFQTAYGKKILPTHLVSIFCLSNEENIDFENLEMALRKVTQKRGLY